MIDICFRYASRIFALVLYLVFLPSFLFAHELWLDTKNFQPKIGDTIAIELRNGQNFKGINLSYLNNRIENFFWDLGGAVTVVNSRSGDVPAMATPALEEGLMVVVYQSTGSTLSYKGWDKFGEFIRHKRLGPIKQLHTLRGLPEANFKESYRRYSKALLGIGKAQGSDRAFGLETEFVILKNPYTENTASGIPVLLLYQNKPRVNAQIEVFQRAKSGKVEVRYQQTDENGKVVLSVLPGHDYLIDAVLLRKPHISIEQRSGAVWESLWAATTFSVPE